jgi:signal transduction histidine kinase
VVAGLAHDLRNPMTTIKTFAGAISSGRFEGDTARELGERVSAECDRLNACLSELERYSGFARPAPQRIDAVTVVREVVQSLEAPAMRRILIAPVGSAWVEADPEQMRFVVDNLVAAALGELPEGQRLLIDAGNERVITLSVPAPGGPVTRLRRIVEGQEQEPSWRIVLARSVAARNGCKVEVNTAGEAMTIRLVLRGGEVGSRGQQTGRTDR